MNTNKKNLVKLIKSSGLFDKKYYLLKYPDVRKSKMNPIEHFLYFGAAEMRNPSNDFDTEFYLDLYPDVKQSNMNPLVHYLMHGKNENRCINRGKFNQDACSIFSKLYFDKKTNNFTEYKTNKPLNTNIKLIAFYLPQFHPFLENDLWWGKGFTEWTNVTKALPNFIGHYQPHLPIHNGFYDLRIPEIMKEQANLAKNYGIYGFNFYYYWFDGKVLMEKPFEILLNNKDIDINFCITWANENWSRRWDGSNSDILISLNHSDADSIKFIKSLYKYFNDPRYIRVDNKPILIIYRADIIPNIKETINLWRKQSMKDGFDGLYLVCAQTFGISSPQPFGFDAAMEFPPHTFSSICINSGIDFINHYFKGHVFDYEKSVDLSLKNYKEPDFKLFRSAMLTWDNTARKQNNSTIYTNFSLNKYKKWLSNLICSIDSNQKYKKDEKLVFINAWNEWAEGTHLEPDTKYGYGYLQSSYDTLNNYLINKKLPFSCKKNNDIAVILHIHFTDLWSEIAAYLTNLKTFGFDLYVTITNEDKDIVNNILSLYPTANILYVENKGRDILPFIKIFKIVKDLNYSYICKIHSKKSVYRNDGNLNRNELFKSLLGNSNTITSIIKMFNSNSHIGLITSSKYLIEFNEKNMFSNANNVTLLTKQLNLKSNVSHFPAGSMFWFKPLAFFGIEKIDEGLFCDENGETDGTISHAIERIFIKLIDSNCFKAKGI